MEGTINSYNSFQGSLSARNIPTDSSGKTEIALTVTSQYSGDNYIVRAVCRSPNNAPFDSNTAVNVDPANQNSNIIYTLSGIAQSGLLVSWKRAYIEEANMYKKGATIIAAATMVNGINAIELSNNDSGYTSAPTVTISGGGGSGASATANFKRQRNSSNCRRYLIHVSANNQFFRWRWFWSNCNCNH